MQSPKFTATELPPETPDAGFTFIEILLAVAIMAISFTAIINITHNSLNTTIRSRQVGTVAMLAKQKMIEAELEFEGKGFKELKEEEEGKFEEPYEDYSWTREIKEIEFPDISALLTAGDDESASGSTKILKTVGQLLSKYLSDSVREVVITITVQKASGEMKYPVATYWVNLNQEFSLSP